jgi:cell division protein FtsN
MKNKDFRELQISSSFLVVIFVGILILGVFIFLLGVSVGKKQVQIASESANIPKIVTEQVKASAPAPAQQPQTEQAGTDKKLIAEELASQPKVEPSIKAEPKKAQKAEAMPQTKTAKPETAKEVKKPAVPPAAQPQNEETAKKGLFFIQVGAFNDKQVALGSAEKFKLMGYPVLIVDPSPTINKFRVRLGGFSTKEEALKALNKLRAESKKPVDYFIARD